MNSIIFYGCREDCYNRWFPGLPPRTKLRQSNVRFKWWIFCAITLVLFFPALPVFAAFQFYGCNDSNAQCNIGQAWAACLRAKAQVDIESPALAPTCALGPTTWPVSVVFKNGGQYPMMTTNHQWIFYYKARSSLPPGTFDLSKNNECDVACGSPFVGNPSNMFTGTKIERSVDYRAAIGHLEWVRFYSSNETVSVAVQSLGKQWRDGYMRSLLVNGDSTGALAVLSRPSGNSYFFKKDATGTWIPELDVRYRLANVTDGAGVVGWIVSDPEGNQERYDVNGRLVEIRYVDGDIIALQYIQGRLSFVSDRTGRVIALQYVDDLLDTVILPDGNSIKYTFDGERRLASVGYQVGVNGEPQYDVVQYKYGSSGESLSLASVLDELGNTYASWNYDSNQRITSSVHGDPAGDIDRVSIVYDSDGATVTNSLGKSVFHAFNAQFGRAKEAASQTLCPSCGAQMASRTYDANGYPDVATDFLGTTTDSDFNVRGLPVQVVDAANDVNKKRTAQTEWHSDFPSPTERRIYNATGVLLAKSTWTYNTRGQPLTTTQTDPVTSTTRTTTTTYCEASDITGGTCPLEGLVTSVDGPRADAVDTTTYTYYPSDEASCATAPTTCPHRKGDLWKVTNALGQVTETLKYDGAGRVLSVKDANNVVTDFEYHPRGWLTASKVRGSDDASEADDVITRIEYWPTGRVKQVTQPDGAYTAYAYDQAHRLTDITDNAGNTMHYTLDNAGHRIAEATKDSGGALKRSLSRVYNQLGQLQTQADAQANPTDFTYDANGNTNTVTDALGRVSDHDYDPLNRLARTLQDVGGIAAETTFQYDGLDNLIKVTDPKGLDTTYTYNGLGDLTQLQSPDTGATTYTYDSAGNRKTQTDARGVTVTYHYDALNRLTGVVYPDVSLNVGYVYDTPQAACISGETFAVGRLTRLEDGSGATQYCYNRFGHRVRKVQTSNGVDFVVRYAYTKAGQLQAMVYPDGSTVDYVRDAQGRVTEVGVAHAGQPREVLLHQASYHPFGPVAGWSYGNGRAMQRTVDLDYRPVSIQGGADGLALSFGFDAVGNLSQLASGSPPPLTYGYDALNRLTEIRDGPTQALIDGYAYDKTGNRTAHTMAAGTSVYGYAPDSHRLADVGGVTRAYDAAGNTASIGSTRQFVYNDAGRMSQVKQAGVVTREYAYNGRGEQVRRFLGSQNIYTLYDEAGRWLGDYDGSGNPTQQAIWMDDLPVGVLANGQVYYVEPDHLSTPRVVIDPVRDVAIWKWDLKGEAFGASDPEQDADGDSIPFVFDMRFPGQRYDPASGMNYNYFRDYEADSGRYTQSDPIGLDGGMTTYTYASSHPLTGFDFDGLEEVNINLYGKGRITGSFDLRPGTYAKAPGVEISLQFNPGERCEQCRQIRWIQTITTNSPKGGAISPYNDPFPPDDGLPFYETDYEYGIRPNSFYDNPRRRPRVSGDVNWSAKLCLVCVGEGSRIISEIKCLRYGFTVNPSGALQASPPKVIPTPKR